MTFQQYPLAMKPPQYRPAVISKDTINRDGSITKAPPGSPVRFPDVFVHNEEQEKQYAALGYLPGGVSDPEEYHRAMTGNEEPSDHKHHEYPRWMYQADGGGDLSVTVNFEVVQVRGVLVNSEQERKQLRGEWHELPSQAAEAALSDDPKSEEAAAAPAPKKASQPRKEAV